MSPLPPMQPGDKLHLAEMTAERKERVEKTCSELVNWLMKNTETPLEALMVLDFVSGALAEKFDVRARTFITADDLKAGQA